MSQIFPKSANATARMSLVGVLSLVLFLGAMIFTLMRSSWATKQNEFVEQPIQFSHAHHVGGVGLDCRYCHPTIETADRPRATEAACLKCHQSAADDGPEFAPVRAAATGGPPVNWEKVNEVPAWITFNHARHVVRGVSCQSCHGRVDQMELTYQAEPLSMDWCMDCHRNPAPHLRRTEDLTKMGFKPPGGLHAYGHKVRNELGINPDNGCVYCHRPRAGAPTLDEILKPTP